MRTSQALECVVHARQEYGLSFAIGRDRLHHATGAWCILGRPRLFPNCDNLQQTSNQGCASGFRKLH